MIQVKRKEMEDWIEFSMTESEAKEFLQQLDSMGAEKFLRRSTIYRLWDMLQYEISRRYE